MDGRIVAHYGDSPYTHAPADYPHDPHPRGRSAPGGGTRQSLYGPAFTAVSAGIASVAGTDLLANRLGFQLLAAACVLALLLLLYRTTRDPVVVALIGCNPVVLIEVVNLGRNDAHRRARRCSPASSSPPAAVWSRPRRWSRSVRW